MLTDLMNLFGSKQQTRLIQYMLDNPSRVFNQAGLARFLSCSPSTVARVVNPLIRAEIIRFEMLGKQMKVFALAADSPKARLLIEFYEKLKALEAAPKNKEYDHNDQEGAEADVV